ncbi:hypothetical protein [Massilia sp. UBA6681]|uniref:hypothetical protein n=1 Tax=Massilia sp. UBA6681 TaxID=1946839 RepID=UPI0025C43135|nr:hypothetical protein [Massilia sp. UBA6681]
MIDQEITPEQPQPFGYVTYDDAGKLTGSYLQVLHPDHADCHIPADEVQRAAWVNYRANEARDGLELMPVKEPTEMPPPVPQTVTRRQARQALLMAELLDDVQPAIDAIPDPVQRRMAQIEWEDSLEFVRTRPLVIQIGAALGLDESALDALFTQAATL